jgi:hypothetical protein
MSRLNLCGRLMVLVWAGGAGCSNGPDAAPETEPASDGPAPAETTSAAAEPTARIAPRIRRLTNAEYDATVQALLGTEQTLAAQFVPDARLFKHGKFDRNEAQIVEPMLAGQLQRAAQSLASEYGTNHLESALPCFSQADATCARTFFESFLPKAYRRPATTAELDALMTRVVTPAIPRDGFSAAVELGIEAALQSTAFLYHTELGAGADTLADVDSTPIELTTREIGEQMAYLLTGGPADAELAAVPDLAPPASRETQAWRLLQSARARRQVQRMIKQWLDIDQTGAINKDETKYPNFTPQMFEREADAFIDEVVFERSAGFELLLGADFTVGSSLLAETYGAPPPSTDPGVIELTNVPRRGILNLGAFVVSYTTPVKRGVRVLTQTLCLDPGDPAALMIQTTLPPLNATKTRRERFEEHSQGICAGCHGMIDSIGFAFDHFNELGQWEADEDGNPELPIDSTTTLQLPASVPFGSQQVLDSAELARLISESEIGSRCFARNLARFTAAAHGDSLEQGFIDEWEKLRAAGRTSMQDLLIAYVKSDSFIKRDPFAEGPAQ